MAFHPDYADNGEVFLSYTGPGGPVFESRLSRFHTSDGLTLDLASEEPILVVEQPYTNHNGGDLGFGRDGYLYFGLGDGGARRRPARTGPRTSDSLLGKMLRIDIDGGDPYAIPPDNPYAAGGGRPEIFALGLRNPWRFSFDRTTGELWAGDVGQNGGRRSTRSSSAATTAGTSRKGLDCFGQDDAPARASSIPVTQYRNTGGASVIAGLVYRGAALLDLAGLFLYTDFYGETLWGVAEGAARWCSARPACAAPSASPRTGTASCTPSPTAAGSTACAPRRPRSDLSSRTCSETGCLDVADPRRPPAGAGPLRAQRPVLVRCLCRQDPLDVPAA